MSASLQPDDHSPLTIEKLADEVRHLAGQVVLMHDTNLALLQGVGMDEEDLYYIASPLGRKDDVVWYSAVGACAGLKEYLPADVYERSERIFLLNTKFPGAFQMMTQLEGAEPEIYDPDVHPARREAIQERQYNERLAEVARANAAYKNQSL